MMRGSWGLVQTLLREVVVGRLHKQNNHAGELVPGFCHQPKYHSSTSPIVRHWYDVGVNTTSMPLLLSSSTPSAVPSAGDAWCIST